MPQEGLYLIAGDILSLRCGGTAWYSPAQRAGPAHAHRMMEWNSQNGIGTVGRGRKLSVWWSRWWRIGWWCLIFGVAPARGLRAEAGADGAGGVESMDLRLEELRRLVFERNESIQIKQLEAEIGRRTHLAEQGLFEPQVVGTIERTDSQRPNNFQQQANLGFAVRPELLERNTTYDAGLEFFTPIGTRFRAGYTLRELANNIQNGLGPEYETFAGARLVQPLLKNAGTGPTLARIRVAAINSEIAFQEYRRQLMLTMAQAEAAYWDLHLTQEQERISGESLALADKILTDNRARVEVGKSSELEVLQAQAGVSLRRTYLNQARQKVYDGGTRLSTLYSYRPAETNALPRAVERPAVSEDPMPLEESYREAFYRNPDYLIRRNQVEQENVRVQYAKNQRLPQLDLKASYGLNGLGDSPGDAWDDIDSHNYAAWAVGLELRIPLAGGIKERHEYRAAQLAKRRALVGLKEAEVQIFNGLDAARRKAQLYREDVGNYQGVSDFHERLLEAQLARLAVGTIDSKTVLETEEKLFQAKAAVVESMVLYCKALLELELVRGSLLLARDFEVSRAQLQRQTEAALRGANVAAPDLEAYQRRVQVEFRRAVHSRY
ncbi:MAG: TolC family protein [Verrucomicrobia bacterium]|nr:TolC family protein [Verrucomicrobiota bacterium]